MFFVQRFYEHVIAQKPTSLYEKQQIILEQPYNCSCKQLQGTINIKHTNDLISSIYIQYLVQSLSQKNNYKATLPKSKLLDG